MYRINIMKSLSVGANNPYDIKGALATCTICSTQKLVNIIILLLKKLKIQYAYIKIFQKVFDCKLKN